MIKSVLKPVKKMLLPLGHHLSKVPGYFLMQNVRLIFLELVSLASICKLADTSLLLVSSSISWYIYPSHHTPPVSGHPDVGLGKPYGKYHMAKLKIIQKKRRKFEKCTCSHVYVLTDNICNVNITTTKY